MSSKIAFASALAIFRLALISIGSLQVAIAGFAVRESVVAVRTVVAIRFQILFPALALAGSLRTVSGQVEAITVARLAHVRLVPVAAIGAIVLGRTLVTIDTHRVVLAVQTDTASLVVAVNVQGGSIAVHFFVVPALRCVSMAITS